MMQIYIFAFLGICLWGAVDANDDFVPVDLGCLEESGKAYKSYDNPKLSWDEGDYYCRITFTDGHLANINNQAEFDFIDSKDTGDRWIGYYGGPTADSFVWTDSGETSYSNWEENSPNNSLTYNAVRIIDHKFQDFKMTEKAGFICQSNCIEDATPSQVTNGLKSGLDSHRPSNMVSIFNVLSSWLYGHHLSIGHCIRWGLSSISCPQILNDFFTALTTPLQETYDRKILN
ncbi:hypothetical protein CAPTEDRAFT_210822 [Capitella teleta]|uniref:C-type lectin domain-containing protein n=1 Tax=Capitella teleta TaxID=283909 RepID=R7U1K7_CAPTE|nr:hypothetical protein CAPTEDRAFT_210822 [Capitella teleta]|eukprot:ELT99839.1 hypothetical protein CAPTEDRAFT_210822 [Capitella teleta]